MLNHFLAYATNTVVLCAACSVATLVFSQKIKDYIAGVPSGFRAAMTSVEDKAKADARAAVADVFSKLTPAAAKAPPVPQAPAPEAPKA